MIPLPDSYLGSAIVPVGDSGAARVEFEFSNLVEAAKWWENVVGIADEDEFIPPIEDEGC